MILKKMQYQRVGKIMISYKNRQGKVLKAYGMN